MVIQAFGANLSVPRGIQQRSHSMNFGTTKVGNSYEFRIWAPDSEQVDLVLDLHSEELIVPMDKREGGWFFVASDLAYAGATYEFIVDREKNVRVPDPASRFQPYDVHGRSEVIDPEEFQWRDAGWLGKEWSSTVIYELNVGTFTPQGTYAGIEAKLDYLVSLGITAIELMPISDFPGDFGWGYDGVLPFAPESSYGRPEDLKRLVQAAHAKGLMVFLDVVYNHFGPEGNHLPTYANKFFTDKHKTPWGSAINYGDEGCEVVRDYFIQNALYWLQEYHFDGLRLDAVHAIKDNSTEHILTSLARAVANGPGAKRHVHLILENDDNDVDLLLRDGTKSELYTAQWSDDIHHAFHILATGEHHGYYADYHRDRSDRSSIEHLATSLTQGFSYQGQASYTRGGESKGKPSDHLPPTAFVSFLQNHDQIGNRAFGDRIASLASPAAVIALSSVQLLAPPIPLLYMGEEWGSKQPFYYFCNMGDDLAPLITVGRRKEFSKFPEFQDEAVRDTIPDPCIISSFHESKLDWKESVLPENANILAHYKSVLRVRATQIAPLLNQACRSSFSIEADAGMCCVWSYASDRLILIANLSGQSIQVDKKTGMVPGDLLAKLTRVIPFYECGANWQSLSLNESQPSLDLPPWSVFWFKL